MPLRERPIACRPDQLFHYWSIEPRQFEQMLEMALCIDPQSLIEKAEAKAKADENDKTPAPPAYAVEDGVAIIEMSGPSTKYPSSYQSAFGGYSTIQKQKAIRDAIKDPQVKALIMKADTPGGTSAGTPELAAEVHQANKVKPVYGVIDDQCTSAGQFVISQCRQVFANNIAAVGSIGTTIRMYDESDKFKRDGVKAVDVGSGKFKNLGMRGKELSEEDRAEIKRMVTAINEPFIQAVASGRKLEVPVIRAMEARIYVGQEAKDVGLVDHIMPAEQAINYIKAITNNRAWTGGHVNNAQKTAASTAGLPARSSTMPLSEAQVQAVRTEVPGAANVSVDQLDTFLAEAAVNSVKQVKALNDAMKAKDNEITGLKGMVVPKCDAKVAEGHLGLFDRQVAQMLKEERLLPEQVELLKGAVRTESKAFNLNCVDANGNIHLPASAVLSAMELNKPKGLTKEQTPGQTQSRQVPESGKQGDNSNAPDADLRKRIQDRAKAQQTRGGAKVTS